MADLKQGTRDALNPDTWKEEFEVMTDNLRRWRFADPYDRAWKWYFEWCDEDAELLHLLANDDDDCFHRALIVVGAYLNTCHTVPGGRNMLWLNRVDYDAFPAIEKAAARVLEDGFVSTMKTALWCRMDQWFRRCRTTDPADIFGRHWKLARRRAGFARAAAFDTWDKENKVVDIQTRKPPVPER